MYNKKEIEAGLKKQLAIDFNCTVEDFDKKENIITFPKDNPGRRIYTQQKEFLSMVTLGGNTVISADERIHEWLKRWSEGKNGIWLFEHNHLMELEGELQKYGKKLWQSHHMYRGMGIGTKLVQLLKNEIWRREAIPFYGTSLSNIYSWNIAFHCGFYPAWVEIETTEGEKPPKYRISEML